MNIVHLMAGVSPSKSLRSLLGLVMSLFLSLALPAAQASPVSFYAISSINSNTSDFFPVSNLIQGPGVAFSATGAHNALAGNLSWATIQPCYPCDYFTTSQPIPRLTLDLGQDRLLSQISIWGYGHPNGASRFSLLFATGAEGTGAFGTSIAYNPVFLPAQQSLTLQDFTFTQNVTARYVRMTITDNYYSASNPGAGGDRVGLSEIAFGRAVPEPGALPLVGLALFGAVACCRRVRGVSRVN